MNDEQLERCRELIEMHAQYGPALSIEGETALLAEVDRLRAIVANVRKVLFEDASLSHEHRYRRVTRVLESEECPDEYCAGWKDSGICPAGLKHW